ncbi:MAG TPA: hypothetical protein VF625_16795 [Longimicrobium sp.]
MMKNGAIKKLSLNVDALQVESFELAPAGANERGTVKAYATDFNCPTGEYNTLQHSCLADTCGYSCETCDFSCGPTCGDTTCYGDTCMCWTKSC